MSHSEDFDFLKAEIQAIPDKEIQLPTTPVTMFTQAGENLHDWAMEDKDRLVARGLDVALIEGLLTAAGACRHAEGLWNEERHTKREAEKEWKEKSPAAYAIRDDLIDEMEYAYTDDEALLKKVEKIKKGTGHEDMIQDLHNIYVLASANKAPLELTNFDMTWLDKATDFSDQMAGILAAANGEKGEDNPVKKMRDKAYTFLKIKVDKVRKCGKFVFRKEEDMKRRWGYLNHYKSQHRKRKDD